MLSISSSAYPDVLVCKSDFSLRAIHEIASAMTQSGMEPDEEPTPLAAVVRQLFLRNGEPPYRWYCIDASATTSVITFSRASNPKLLRYCNRPVRIAASDAVPQQLLITPTDIVKPSWRKDRLPATFIGEA